MIYQEQRRRIEAVERVCRLDGSTPITHELFIYLPQYNLLYCMSPKVGMCVRNNYLHFPTASLLRFVYRGAIYQYTIQPL